jgi:xanthine/uracil permease
MGFVGPRLPIVMGVFYIFIGPIVAISKEINLAAAMTALIIGGAVQFA